MRTALISVQQTHVCGDNLRTLGDKSQNTEHGLWTSISHLILDETYTKPSFYFIDPYAQKRVRRLEPRASTGLDVALLSLLEINNIPNGNEILTGRLLVNRYGQEEQSKNSRRPSR